MQAKFLKYALATCLAAALVSPVLAQTSPVVVDGNMWSKSSPDVRKAFVVGAGNMMMLETAYAKKKGTPVPVASEKAAAALTGLTLDQVTDRITRWYEVNPSRRNMPVIGVMWEDMISPSAAK